MADLVDYALTSLADVKESLGIASGDHSKDNLVIRKINQVTDAIESYCQRRFLLTSYQEEYKASHIDEIVLKQRPIVIDGGHPFLAEWRTTAFDADIWEPIDSQLYFVDQAAGVLNLMYDAQGHWNRYRYSYWAGYATIPNDLAEAANMLACFYTNNPAGLNVGVQARQEGQRRTQYYAIPNSFKSVMQQLGVDETIDAYANTPVLTDR